MESPFNISALYTSVVGDVAAALLVYVVGLAVYRLVLSPIAGIPGPKLAALTQWYETYFELFKSPTVGQFMFHYRNLHDRYGPIIRLSPREVHIQDSEFFHSLYSQRLLWDKPEYLQHRFGNETGLFPTPDYRTHRARRTALNPLFSKRAVYDFSPFLQAQMDKLCNRVNQNFRGSSTIVRLDRMFACYSADAVVAYCLESQSSWLEAPDFYCDFAEAMKTLLYNVHLVTQFPWFGSLMNALPKSWLAKLSTEIRVVHKFEQEMSRQIKHILDNPRPDDGSERKSVFRALLESHLPPEELSLRRLQHEALTIIGAAVETTAHALSVGSFHIMNTPRIYQRLREELQDTIPNADDMPSLEKLERLPYLDACIQESLRLSYGTSQRAHRVSKHLSIRYGSYVIPPGVTISMDNYAVAHDERIFPDSHTFAPERWLGDPRAPDGKPLTAYMVSFGRGTRQCLGMPLAFAEMYIVTASLFRRFELDLYETDRAAVDCVSDTFAPRPRPDTMGVRAFFV